MKEGEIYLMDIDLGEPIKMRVDEVWERDIQGFFKNKKSRKIFMSGERYLGGLRGETRYIASEEKKLLKRVIRKIEN